MKKQSFLLWVENEKVMGFLSYREMKEVKITDTLHIVGDYVSTVIVVPECRGKGITKALYRELESNSKGIITRTWSTNDSHLKILQDLGFHVLVKIIGDRGNGISTMYYRKILV